MNNNTFFKKINKLRYLEHKEKENNKFQKWLSLTDHNYISNKEKINLFIDQLNILIKKNNYFINDEKSFKDEIATFIYKSSDFNGKQY